MIPPLPNRAVTPAPLPSRRYLKFKSRTTRVYAATSPDGRIYRIEGNAKPTVFYEPKAKYIWAMLFDAQTERNLLL